MRRSLAQRVALNASVMVAGQALAAALGLASVAIITRYLGVGRYGGFLAALVFVSFCSLFTDWGLTTIGAREISKRPERRHEILSSLLAISLLSSVAIAAVALGLGLLIYSGAHEAAVRTAIAILVAQILLDAPTAPGRASFVVRESAYMSTVSDLANRAVALALLVVAVVLHRGVAGVALAYVGGTAAGTAAVLSMARRAAWIRPRFTRGISGRLFRGALPLAATNLVNYLYFRADLFLISVMLTSAAVGVYGVAYKVVEILIVLPGYITVTFFPRMSAASADGDAVRTLSQKAYATLQLVAAPIVLACIMLAPQMVRVIGSSGFGQSVTILRILAIGSGFAFLNGLFATVLVARNAQSALLRATAAVLAFNVCLNLVCIPVFGVVGAAAVNSVSECFVFLVIRHLYRRRVADPPALHEPLKLALAVLAMAAVLAPATAGVGGAGAIVPAIALGVAGLGVYVTTLAALGALPFDLRGAVPLPRRAPAHAER